MDVVLVLAGCVGYGVASGLCAADEVGVGVDAALRIGFVGDREPPAEPERAGAGPIFRGARTTGGALVDMITAAISLFSVVCLPVCVYSVYPPCLVLLFPCWGHAFAYQIDRRTVGGIGMQHVTVGQVDWLQRSQSGGLPFHWAVFVI